MSTSFAASGILLSPHTMSKWFMCDMASYYSSRFWFEKLIGSIVWAFLIVETWAQLPLCFADYLETSTHNLFGFMNIHTQFRSFLFPFSVPAIGEQWERRAAGCGLHWVDSQRLQIYQNQPCQILLLKPQQLPPKNHLNNKTLFSLLKIFPVILRYCSFWFKSFLRCQILVKCAHLWQQLPASHALSRLQIDPSLKMV